MFDRLSNKIGGIANKLRGSARVTEKDLDRTLREMRMALLEADVALPVVRHLLEDARARALGADVAKSLNPGQVIVKILNDVLTDVLGGQRRDLNISQIPSVILLCGLQGAGKTTTAGKLAKLLIEQGRKVALTSVDATRPAAREQLEILAKQVNVPYLTGNGADAVTMAQSALLQAKTGGHHVLILDTAGRQVIDEGLMAEISAVSKAVHASEQLLVLDAMTGQTALQIAEHFHQTVSLTGCILTKTDADMRGGAAISVSHTTGVPVRYVGTGEKVDAFELFDPQRMAGRILGQGDVVGLVEKIQKSVDKDKAEQLAKKVNKGSFDLMDFAEQLGQMQNMGGMASMMKMLPGANISSEMLAQVDDKPMKRMQAMVYSMTAKERQYPRLINGSRKKRIANGSGTSVQELNKMLKQFAQMQKMMKKMKGGAGKRMMAQLAGKLGAFGGMPKL
ncbi:MAG: signal recognition particle protein [Zetaproteobacteria bacterium CG_4_9_14_3_um_filter_49_83]|nr:MAG: signal recognition particle protein [Zetaproteobacteria bacterium CG1_02_49_23]PIQ34495.1 MAG: signal recognition particle protein [Zetaproteobacteria bacterium CG17_big_fil_post_rev_8_21_14_2_50_50_13]PIV29783.1 MAG: signal recognition particle protein [Zetaproteobacteria bacterium CG02_land_8_20_14_3_00_50_9]PIY56078.1 MAG: signal recognition particle protein [Zetaproteobacteria bacterium CG_4_10_14_0_8_um_filter_49_80]PJA34518.1 MAG: signal recognition particle protein [Zetaproteobac